MAQQTIWWRAGQGQVGGYGKGRKSVYDKCQGEAEGGDPRCVTEQRAGQGTARHGTAGQGRAGQGREVPGKAR